ncbi:MAG: hypothetical protein HZB14_10485 [Actinobacteria bacterium]|nr:hypothetical protein [Actinomycetota bacterium]
MTLFRRSHLIAALAALVLAAFAVAAVAAPKARIAAGAKASVSVAKCRSASTYADRRLEFRAAMSAVGGGGKMELRYTLLRRYNKQARFRVVTPTDGSSLGQWLSSSDPTATKYIHNLAITPIETAAVYRVKVAYRWFGANGKIVKRAKRTSKLCKQKRGLPNLKVVSVQQYPNAGPVFPDLPVVWVVTVTNDGASSASLPAGLIVSGTANGGLTDGTVDAQPLNTLDTIPAGATVTRQLYGQECRNGPVQMTADPMSLARERNENDNGFKGSC